MISKLKDLIFNNCKKFLIKDLINLIYLYTHTIIQTEHKINIYSITQLLDLFHGFIPKNELESLNFQYLINDISSFVYTISYLTSVELYIDDVIRERKIFTDFDELRMIHKFDIDGRLIDSICFDKYQNIEIEMVMKKYQNDIYKKLTVHSFKPDTSIAVFKNDKLDGLVKDIGTYFLYKDGKKLNPNWFQRIKCIYKDIQQNQLIFGTK